jgi:hypothetical protein
MLRPARWLERLASPRRRFSAADRPARLRQSLAAAEVSLSPGLLSLLGPTIPCRGRTCTCKHVKDRRLHIGICFGVPPLVLDAARVNSILHPHKRGMRRSTGQLQHDPNDCHFCFRAVK